MSQYEARLEKDLAGIRQKLTDLSGAVCTALENSARGFFEVDRELSYSVCLADHPINRDSRALDKACHGFIAVHLPSAGHLRFVSAVMHINIEVERIGDYAKTISREAVQLEKPPVDSVLPQLRQVAQEAQQLLRHAVSAFDNDDAEAAREGIRQATEAGPRFNAGFSALADAEGTVSLKELLSYLVIMNNFDRVVDQAKNICEETVFAVTGETKTPKSYRILFLDADNSLLGPMAQSIASRNHPQSGQYHTAGREAAAAFHDGLGKFLEERGVVLANSSPQALGSGVDLDAYHAIVSLQGPVKDYIDRVPYSTIALEWDLDTSTTQGQDPLESIYRSLAPRLQDLMMTLHGEETS